MCADVDSSSRGCAIEWLPKQRRLSLFQQLSNSSRSQRLIFRSIFSPSTIEIPRIKFQLLGLAASIFPHWAVSPTLYSDWGIRKHLQSQKLSDDCIWIASLKVWSTVEEEGEGGRERDWLTDWPTTEMFSLFFMVPSALLTVFIGALQRNKTKSM